MGKKVAWQETPSAARQTNSDLFETAGKKAQQEGPARMTDGGGTATENEQAKSNDQLVYILSSTFDMVGRRDELKDP